MITVVTPRLILASTPLEVIDRRLGQDDFVAGVPIAVGDEAGGRSEVLRVRFPPEWPGDALVLFPLWKKRMEADPSFEVLGGTMIDRAEMLAVGQMSFREVPDEAGTAELGYGVNPAYQGRGYATEMAGALVRWVEVQPGIRRITSACLVDNVASGRVLEKAGFRRIGERTEEEGRLIL